MPFFSRSSGSDRGPRRRRGDREDAARLAFEVEEFEFVAAGGDAGLLRLSGRWTARPERMVPLPVEIELERDGHAIRLEVLPDPTAPVALATPEGETWRGAFMVEAELAEDPRADFALVADGEVVAGLPRPGDWEVLTNQETSGEEDHEDLPGAEAELFEETAADGSGALPELLAALEEVAEAESESEEDAELPAHPDEAEGVVPLEISPDDVAAEHIATREAAEQRAEETAAALERATSMATLQR
nr:hypothetical protein [Actinomycetota bacterium]